MLRGKTESGFEYELDDDVLDDYELLEMFCKIDEGETNLTTKMVNMLLGEEQKERLKNHVRAKSGRVSARRLLVEVTEILNSTKEGKNC